MKDRGELRYQAALQRATRNLIKILVHTTRQQSQDEAHKHM